MNRQYTKQDIDELTSDQTESLEHLQSEGRILIVTSVEAEREAVMQGLRGSTRFEVRVCGVGQATAAARTATALAEGTYTFVLNMGIAGGFREQAEVESIVIASEVIAADLGAETAAGFISLDELGFGSTRQAVEKKLATSLYHEIQKQGIPVTMGPILSVSTVTGTAETALALASRVVGAKAEAMEGYGVAVAAQQKGVPMLELRAISNVVGPRDRESWRIKEALHRLTEVSTILVEVLA